jgi:hypothetical protein
VSDKKLAGICKAFRDGLLNNGPSCLMCAVVCRPLAGYLSSIGIDCEEVLIEFEWGNHMFLRLRDGRVLDPTADQFGDMKLPPIYIGKPLSIHTAAQCQ